MTCYSSIPPFLFINMTIKSSTFGNRNTLRVRVNNNYNSTHFVLKCGTKLLSTVRTHRHTTVLLKSKTRFWQKRNPMCIITNIKLPQFLLLPVKSASRCPAFPSLTFLFGKLKLQEQKEKAL